MDFQQNWESFFSAVIAVLQEEVAADERTVTHALARIDNCVNGLLRVAAIMRPLMSEQHTQNSCNRFVSQIESILQYLYSQHSRLLKVRDDLLCVDLCSDISAGHVELLRTGYKGRPKLLIERNQLEYLRSLQFTWSEIASLFGLSRSTLYRRRKECGIPLGRGFSECSDEELEAQVIDLKAQMPDVGEKMLRGALIAHGIMVGRERLRAIIHKVDPINTALRWSTFVVRRPYSVLGANSLWHLGMNVCA